MVIAGIVIVVATFIAIIKKFIIVGPTDVFYWR